jgi:hypothetical protein
LIFNCNFILERNHSLKKVVRNQKNYKKVK